jgi:hypothetical protein
MQEAQEAFVGDLAGAAAAEHVALEEILLARFTRCWSSSQSITAAVG